MQIPLYQVDAFTNRPFSGNPAAVCPLTEWIPDVTMQAIAAENNLAETAFFVRSQSGDNGRFDLRWFTPVCEVDLCGHATLASAFVLFRVMNEGSDLLRFQTKSGELTVRRDGDLLVLDFPARMPKATQVHPDLLPALGGNAVEVLAARDYLVRFASQDDVAALTPNMMGLMGVDKFAVIVTAPGKDCDFVSRFFAPSKGIPEDPVTGSAHSTLIPYWAEQLGKTELYARQISKRGGELLCKLKGDRVEMAGHGALFLRGEISIP